MGELEFQQHQHILMSFPLFISIQRISKSGKGKICTSCSSSAGTCTLLLSLSSPSLSLPFLLALNEADHADASSHFGRLNKEESSADGNNRRRRSVTYVLPPRLCQKEGVKKLETELDCGWWWWDGGGGGAAVANNGPKRAAMRMRMVRCWFGGYAAMLFPSRFFPLSVRFSPHTPSSRLEERKSGEMKEEEEYYFYRHFSQLVSFLQLC